MPEARFGTPLNSRPEIEGRILSSVSICDVTLRDGEQGAAAAFTAGDKVRVAIALEELGVGQIQVGFVRSDVDTIRAIKKAGVKTPLELVCPSTDPTWRDDFERAVEADTDVVHVLIRSRDELITAMGWSRESILERTAEAVSLAKTLGAQKVTFAPSFATQADLDFLLRLHTIARDAGADQVNVSDSLGVARPAAIAFLVRQVKAVAQLPVGVHCHNDFGMAVACSLAGAEAGATWIDACINGIGERGGNTALEAVVMALKCLYAIDCGIDTPRLRGTSQLVGRLLDVGVPAGLPVVGDNAFAQKIDAHVRISAKNPELLEPYDPTMVGNRRWVSLGKGSGPYAVRAKLDSMGLSVPDEKIDELVEWVNAQAELDKSYVGDEIFAARVALI